MAFRAVLWQVLLYYQPFVGVFIWKTLHMTLGQFCGRYYQTVKTLATFFQLIPCTFRAVLWQVHSVGPGFDSRPQQKLFFFFPLFWLEGDLSLHSNFQSLLGITIKLWTPRRFFSIFFFDLLQLFEDHFIVNCLSKDRFESIKFKQVFASLCRTLLTYICVK